MVGSTDTVTVAEEDATLRLDRWFRRHYPALGHGRLEKLLRTGRIRVDGKRARAGDRVAPGQAIHIPPLEELAAPVPPVLLSPRPGDEAMLRDAVLHRDDAVIVLNKPPGLAVQGGNGIRRCRGCCSTLASRDRSRSSQANVVRFMPDPRFVRAIRMRRPTSARAAKRWSAFGAQRSEHGRCLCPEASIASPSRAHVISASERIEAAVGFGARLANRRSFPRWERPAP
jgi:hypothetical protein